MSQNLGFGSVSACLRRLGRRATDPFLGPAPPPWSELRIDVPVELRTAPGLPAESIARQQEPLRDFRQERPLEDGWSREVQGRPPVGLRERFLRRAIDFRLAQLRRVARRASRRGGNATSRGTTPEAFSEAVRRSGIGAGLSSVAVARYDERWQFAECRDWVCGDRMIVAVVEQDYARMQQAPDAEYQLTVRRTYIRLLQGAIEIAALLRNHGYSARVYESDSGAMTLPYAIAAGVGQLGMNGQVLTPQAGSRTRMLLISTDAPLPLDEPVDFGIPGVCEECGICARRCPVGAISLRRREHRGAVKWKIKTDRCLPMVALADGCAVCIKACPIQHHGLEAVLNHYRRNGDILGRGSDLEAYTWPLDGRTYASGESPRLGPEARLPRALARARADEAEPRTR